MELNYAGYQEHKKEHREFLKTTVSFCQRVVAREHNLIDDLCEFLEQWLAKHILGTDKKFTECFNKNGLV